MAVTVNINGNIQVGDTTSDSAPYQFPLSGLSMSGVAEAKGNPLSVGTSPVSVNIPNGAANFVFIENLHATQTLTVAWTPNGGSPATVVTLQPKSAIMLIEAAASSGITALTLTGSGAGTTVALILAG
jgi:hypothetical protein